MDLKPRLQTSGHAGRQTVEGFRHARRSGRFHEFPCQLGLRAQSEFTAVCRRAKRYAKSSMWATFMKDLVPTPAPAPDTTVELDGKWKFMPDPPTGFEQSRFDDVSWGEIDVPAHWVMQGYQAEKGQGGYRRHVQIPAGLSGAAAFGSPSMAYTAARRSGGTWPTAWSFCTCGGATPTFNWMSPMRLQRVETISSQFA